MYIILPSIKNYQVSNAYVFPFGFRKGKSGNLIVPSSELYQVLGWIYSKLGKEKALYTCILDLTGGRVGYHGWTEFCYMCYLIKQNLMSSMLMHTATNCNAAVYILCFVYIIMKTKNI